MCLPLIMGTHIVTYHQSHSITCHPTPVNKPRLNPKQIIQYSIHLPLNCGKLWWPGL